VNEHNLGGGTPLPMTDVFTESQTGDVDRLQQFDPMQRKNACTIYNFDPVYLGERPAVDLHLISPVHKRHLLRHHGKTQEEQQLRGATVLDRLQTLAPHIGESFAIKTSAIEDLTFRLLNEHSHADGRETSYVALSYT
jgi:hypothetical protein